jgi:gp16 family phage-associated protein
MIHTSEQIKTKFKREGKSFVAWSAEHNFKYDDVIRVLNGFSKAQRGKGHEIAVKLGMKAAN